MQTKFIKYLKNKQLITAIVAIIVIFLLILFIRQKNTPLSNTTENKGDEITTGIIYSTPSARTRADELVDILITISPIEEQIFQLKFDYQKNRFSVTLTPPTNESYNSFITWINDHGFKEIPLNNFFFENFTFPSE